MKLNKRMYEWMWMWCDPNTNIHKVCVGACKWASWEEDDRERWMEIGTKIDYRMLNSAYLFILIKTSQKKSHSICHIAMFCLDYGRIYGSFVHIFARAYVCVVLMLALLTPTVVLCLWIYLFGMSDVRRLCIFTQTQIENNERKHHRHLNAIMWCSTNRTFIHNSGGCVSAYS